MEVEQVKLIAKAVEIGIEQLDKIDFKDKLVLTLLMRSLIPKKNYYDDFSANLLYGVFSYKKACDSEIVTRVVYYY